MKIGYARAMRVAKAALAIVDVEAKWSAEGRAPGGQAAKRELRDAVDDYLSHHSSRLGPPYGSEEKKPVAVEA